MTQPNKVDVGLCLETQGYPKKKVKTKQSLSVDQRLRVMINDTFNNSDQLKELFNQYQRKNLLTNLNELRHKLKGGAQVDLQHQLSQNSLKSIELDDDDQINFFMQQICREVEGMNTVSILGLQEKDDTKQKEDTTHCIDEFEQWENMKHLIQKRITKAQMQKIIVKEEALQRQKLIQQYKNTKIEQFDVDTKNQRMNMITMKKVCDAQTDQFESTVGKQTHSAPKINKKFVRNPNAFSSKFLKIDSAVKIKNSEPAIMISPLIRKNQSQGIKPAVVRPATAKFHIGYFMGKEQLEINLTKPDGRLFYSTNHKKSQSLAFNSNSQQSMATSVNGSTRPNTSMKRKQASEQYNNIFDGISSGFEQTPVNMIQEFIVQCEDSLKKSHRYKYQTNLKINSMQNNLKRQLSQISCIQESDANQVQEHHEQFEEFHKKNKFKKKLLTFLMNRTPNKSEILSQVRQQQMNIL